MFLLCGKLIANKNIVSKNASKYITQPKTKGLPILKTVGGDSWINSMPIDCDSNVNKNNNNFKVKFLYYVLSCRSLTQLIPHCEFNW